MKGKEKANRNEPQRTGLTLLKEMGAQRVCPGFFGKGCGSRQHKRFHLDASVHISGFQHQ